VAREIGQGIRAGLTARTVERTLWSICRDPHTWRRSTSTSLTHIKAEMPSRWRPVVSRSDSPSASGGSSYRLEPDFGKRFPGMGNPHRPLSAVTGRNGSMA
jgi:hypothetical protein